MSRPDYECKKCGKSYSHADYSEDPYCPACGIHLGRKSLSPEPFKVDGLFKEFMRLEGFTPGEGVCYDNVPLWISARKRAYAKYQEKFAASKLLVGENWRLDYKDFLYFKNNQSWTTFTRPGLEALKEPEKLRNLLIYLQEESITIEKRVQEGLQGEKHIHGVSQNILTGLLHTFHPDKYGAWNYRTDDALERIKRKPIKTTNAGKNYVSINEALTKLAKELNTDLTTIDGFMWFISKG
jgi:hypothetical protein